MDLQREITLQHLINWVGNWKKTCEMNSVNPANVPVYIKFDNRKYRPFSGGIGFGSEGTSCSIEFFKSDVVTYEPKDKRPEGSGEFWRSRGVSSYDVSGFVQSKPAGERLLRMVKYILETDTPKTWLDYREYEPNWIQFKFSAEEFDIKKLDKLAVENDNVITEEIVRKCVLKARPDEV